jgi:hypothetical protein
LIAKDTEEGSVLVGPAAKQIPMRSDKFLAMLHLT